MAQPMAAPTNDVEVVACIGRLDARLINVETLAQAYDLRGQRHDGAVKDLGDRVTGLEGSTAKNIREFIDKINGEVAQYRDDMRAEIADARAKFESTMDAQDVDAGCPFSSWRS